MCGGQQLYRECSVGIECQIVSEIQQAESEEDLEKVLESHEGVTVHPNHYLMMDARQEIVKRLVGCVDANDLILHLLQGRAFLAQFLAIWFYNLQRFYRLYNTIATIAEIPKRVERAKKMVVLVKSLLAVTEKFYPGKNKIKGIFLEKFIFFTKASHQNWYFTHSSPVDLLLAICWILHARRWTKCWRTARKNRGNYSKRRRNAHFRALKLG